MANLRFVYRLEECCNGSDWVETTYFKTYDTLQGSYIWSYGGHTYRLGSLASILDIDIPDPLSIRNRLYYDGWFSVPDSCPPAWADSSEFKPSSYTLVRAVSRLSELGFVDLSMKVLNRLHEVYPAVSGGVKYAL